MRFNLNLSNQNKNVVHRWRCRLMMCNMQFAGDKGCTVHNLSEPASETNECERIDIWIWIKRDTSSCWIECMFSIFRLFDFNASMLKHMENWSENILLDFFSLSLSPFAFLFLYAFLSLFRMRFYLWCLSFARKQTHTIARTYNYNYEWFRVCICQMHALCFNKCNKFNSSLLYTIWVVLVLWWCSAFLSADKCYFIHNARTMNVSGIQRKFMFSQPFLLVSFRFVFHLRFVFTFIDCPFR